ncbi:hypothetical protein HHI36_012461 [Cryptolaemus montrouzieri]|uniref:CHK kinase-like domain-containing protein n=1 Tax=Cryptolaemus montrouzieri TaxID=559131 RepID=A0ABD2NEP0_9CUCU
MSEKIRQNLKVIVPEIVEKMGINEYELEIGRQIERGQNYMGTIIFFKVICKDNMVTHNFVMKVAKVSEALRKNIPVEKAFNRELVMYNEVFPAFQNLIAEVYPAFEFDCIPKVYWTNSVINEEALILENLETRGYLMYDRTKPWDFDHVMLAMENFGRFHALSLALRDQKPAVFENLKKKITTSILMEYAKKMNLWQFHGKYLKHAKDLLSNSGREDLVKKFDSFDEEIESIIQDPIEEDKIVISHGDSWSCNFMFKYQEEYPTKPLKICMLDYQLSYVDSPVRDLSYNIYTTCDKTCLDQLDLLLQGYYSSLSRSLRNLGSDPEQVFTYEQLKRHWKQYSKFGLLLSSCIIKLELTENSDAPDLQNSAEEGKEVNDYYDAELQNEEEYDRRILDVFTHYGDDFL